MTISSMHFKEVIETGVLLQQIYYPDNKHIDEMLFGNQICIPGLSVIVEPFLVDLSVMYRK